MTRITFIALLFVAASTMHAQSVPTLETQAKVVLQHYMDAERDFDPTLLAALVSANYVEVSPLGEVDDHNRFLGFYAPANKIPTPAMTLTEDHFSSFNNGSGGVYVGKMVWHIPGTDGALHDDALRVMWVFGREDGALKIQSAEYTPIHPHKT